MPDEWPQHAGRAQIVFTFFRFAADERLTNAVDDVRHLAPSPMKRSRTARARCRC